MEEDEDKQKNSEGPDRSSSSGMPVQNISPPRNVPANRPTRTTELSSSPISGFMFPGMAASPPQFVSLEQIMSAAKGVTNMVLCHEIAVNQDFMLQKAQYKEKGLEHQVKEIVERAFWDVFSEELAEDPPRYNQAMVLLTDIKKGLHSFLTPSHSRLSSQIDEVLDIDLIQQQAEQGTLEVQHYAAFILTMMSRLCAPVRDQRIKELSELKEIVPLFRGILELLDLMKLDMANFTIQQFRPKIQQHSIEYERSKFQEFLQSQAVMYPLMDGLEFTRKWLERNHRSLLVVPVPNASDDAKKVTLNQVLSKAFLELLEWDQAHTFPETVVIDQGRFHELGGKFLLCTVVGTILLVTLSVCGPDLQALASFKEQLKKSIMLILQDHTTQLNSVPVLQEQLQNVAEQMCKEVRECFQEKGLSSFTQEQSTALKEQVLAVASPQHRVRILVRSRVLSFLEQVISSSSASPIQVPPGLTSLKSQLESVAAQFLRLVDHNKAVFFTYYNDIFDSSSQSTDNDTAGSKPAA